MPGWLLLAEDAFYLTDYAVFILSDWFCCVPVLVNCKKEVMNFYFSKC
jgi:hypothetical protein